MPFGFVKGCSWVRAGRRGACLTGTTAADVSSLATLVSTKSSVSEGEEQCDRTERSVFRRALDVEGTGWTRELSDSFLPNNLFFYGYFETVHRASLCELTVTTSKLGTGASISGYVVLRGEN